MTTKYSRSAVSLRRREVRVGRGLLFMERQRRPRKRRDPEPRGAVDGTQIGCGSVAASKVALPRTHNSKDPSVPDLPPLSPSPTPPNRAFPAGPSEPTSVAQSVVKSSSSAQPSRPETPSRSPNREPKKKTRVALRYGGRRR